MAGLRHTEPHADAGAAGAGAGATGTTRDRMARSPGRRSRRGGGAASGTGTCCVSRTTVRRGDRPRGSLVDRSAFAAHRLRWQSDPAVVPCKPTIARVGRDESGQHLAVRPRRERVHRDGLLRVRVDSIRDAGRRRAGGASALRPRVRVLQRSHRAEFLVDRRAGQNRRRTSSLPRFECREKEPLPSGVPRQHLRGGGRARRCRDGARDAGRVAHTRSRILRVIALILDSAARSLPRPRPPR
jgi:hypothetical protein